MRPGTYNRHTAIEAHWYLAALFLISNLFLTTPLRAADPSLQAAQPAPAQNAGAANESPNDLFVNVGKSVLVDSALRIERVSVGFGEVAEASAVGPTEVLVNGKAPGQTSLIIWQQGGSKLFFDVTVQPSRYANDTRIESLRRQLDKELPTAKIDISIEGDMVFLRGTVKSLTDSNRAVAISSAIGKPVNLLYVDVPAPRPQVLLKVKFASVDRSLSTQLGINLFSLGALNTLGAVTTGQFSPPVVSSSSNSQNNSVGGKRGVATLSNALNILFFRPDLDFGATIQALQVQGLLQVLAEPNVLAEDGKQASFLAGGEFPFPVVQGTGVGGTNAITIEFRQFGVRLNFIPTITPSGSIHLQVAPEVSSLDFTNGVQISGFTVPGLSVRNVNTEVELTQGQSFAISGLLDNRETETFNKIPFIGDIPILGKFFQSKTTAKQNTELMVIITPEIVQPIQAGQPIPSLNYPSKFLSDNTGKGAPATGPQTAELAAPAPAQRTIPIETLVESMRPERPLLVTSAVSGGAGSVSNQSSGSGGVPAAPPATPAK